ncbi:MAG: hypothetical protein OXC30_04765 [Alphaproteobacteria bacterium]|nr:hypothetical protein [Alphaproteobacteria bacterium]
MINVFLFSLFMFFVNTDAVSASNNHWFREEDIAANYKALRDNLKLYNITTKNSPLLRKCFEHVSVFSISTLLIKIDTGILLHTLSQKSVKNPEELVQTLCEQNAYLGKKGALQCRSCALGQWMPVVNCDDLEKALMNFDALQIRLRAIGANVAQVVEWILGYYAHAKGADRFISQGKDKFGINEPQNILGLQLMDSYQYLQQYQQPMTYAVVPQCCSPMQSYVMDPDCEYQYPPMQSYMMDPRRAPQIQTSDSDRYLTHLGCYVWRGAPKY